MQYIEILNKNILKKDMEKNIKKPSLLSRSRFFIIFFMIGTLCVFIDYGIYLALWKLTNHIIVPKILSSIVSVSVNYLLNSKFNFNNRQKYSVKLYIRYLIIYAILISLNATVNTLFVRFTNNIKISFWLAAAIAAFINYFAIKIFFRKINEKPKE